MVSSTEVLSSLVVTASRTFGADKPLRGRSKHLCETIRKLGISVERIQITWPMEGYGCISPVSFEDFAKACAVPE